jgi:hypothetical protein
MLSVRFYRGLMPPDNLFGPFFMGLGAYDYLFRQPSLYFLLPSWLTWLWNTIAPAHGIA